MSWRAGYCWNAGSVSGHQDVVDTADLGEQVPVERSREADVNDVCDFVVTDVLLQLGR